eukprot:7391822-Prymnesium_polylepis.1
MKRRAEESARPVTSSDSGRHRNESRPVGVHRGVSAEGRKPARGLLPPSAQHERPLYYMCG